MLINFEITIINVKVHVHLYIVTFKDLFLKQYLDDFINVNFYDIPVTVIDVILVMNVNLLVFVHLLDYIHLIFNSSLFFFPNLFLSFLFFFILFLS